MRSFVARQLHTVASFIEPGDPTLPPPFPPSSTESDLAYRNETALSLLDPDVHGFVLLTLRGTGNDNRIRLDGYAPQLWWPALRVTMRGIIEESYDRRPVPAHR